MQDSFRNASVAGANDFALGTALIKHPMHIEDYLNTGNFTKLGWELFTSGLIFKHFLL